MAKHGFHNCFRVVLADNQITIRWFAKQIGAIDMTIFRKKANKILPSIVQCVEIVQVIQIYIKDLLEVAINYHNEYNLYNFEHTMLELVKSKNIPTSVCLQMK